MKAEDKAQEEEQKEEPQEEPADSNLEETKKITERLEAANKKQEELIAKQAALFEMKRAKEALAGQAEAGIQRKPETPEEYARKVMNGEIKPTS